MVDIQRALEPIRNLVVSSTLPNSQAEKTSSEQLPPAVSSVQQYSLPQSFDMAVPFVQQPFDAPYYRLGQPYMPPHFVPSRKQLSGHQHTRETFNMTDTQRALPVYHQCPGGQALLPAQQVQQRFPIGPFPAAFQPLQQVHQIRGEAASADAQFYNIANFQPFFDPYGQQYLQAVGQHGQPSQQPAFAVPYSSSYGPQYSLSASPTQTHCVPWFGLQHQMIPYYSVLPTFVSPQAPAQQTTQAPSQHVQQPAQVQYPRRHSVPIRNCPSKKRLSDANPTAVTFTGQIGQKPLDCPGQEDFVNAKGFGKSKQGVNETASTSDCIGPSENVSPPATLHSPVTRGPPRKPKQSGHALWVGNLPQGTNVVDLKDYFARGAMEDIESVFLISKTNCAFINYRTEAACNEAMARFHDSRFQGTRLVCRLRRNSATSTISTAAPPSPSLSAEVSTSTSHGEKDGEVMGDTSVEGTKIPPKTPTSASVIPRETGKDRIFIVKSLTVEDLDISVRNGVWATQSHNEAAFNKAFENAENVFLIFSANKSGEFYGYARMVSPIADSPTNTIDWVPSAQQVGSSLDLPKAIFTPPTETAPQGRIIDDSARGTLFWEAITEDEASESNDNDDEGDSEKASAVPKAWSKPFKVEWISTVKVPFYRTRGLANKWNANREVKIARDGTELEEKVGKRLIQMFHTSDSGPTSSTTDNLLIIGVTSSPTCEVVAAERRNA